MTYMYADYAYYTTTYGGREIPATDYNKVAQQASDFIDYYTQGRAEENKDDDRIKRAACAIAEKYNIINKADAESLSGGALKSESVGGYSVSYESPDERTKRAREDIAALARQYLWPWTYRGVPCMG